MDVKKEINYASLLMNQTLVGQRVYQNFDKMMYLGGDNLRGLFSKIEVLANKALVVSGSGDFGLETIYQGFSDVTCFDINLLSRHMLYVKIAAVQALTYQEFCRLFQTTLTKEWLYKISPYLPDSTFLFFDTLFQANSSSKLLNLFTHKYSKCAEYFFQKCQQNFSVYNEKEFYQLKECLRADMFHFLPLDIFQKEKVSTCLNEYDFIYLSNILFFASISIEDFLKNIFPYFYQSLRSGGVLVLNYFHSYINEVQEKMVFKNRLYQKKNLELYDQIKNYCNQEIVLPSSGFGHGTGRNDLVLAIKK